MTTSPRPGGVVAAVEADSPAERAGIVVGDVVMIVDGEDVIDVLDWQWKTADAERVVLGMVRAGSPLDVVVSREPSQPWGIGFADPLFDGMRTCRNACVFCFMRQLPAGLRPALYLRDDDYRLSFLDGNFITLTNLDEADVDRIVEQRLSPLYVSVHAVDPQVRARLVCPSDDVALERLDQLLAGGIEVHAQIVLVPGLNDGDVLDETLTWLAEREGVVSVAIVPLGFTRHQSRFDRSYNDPASAARVIAQVQRWQVAWRDRDGVTWVHLADEFYLNARAPFPSAEWYDDFPHYENGVGIVRTFVDEARGLRDELAAAARALPVTDSVTVVCGVMAATTLAGALHAIDAVGRVRVLAVPNRFFGGNVAVTGLLTGADISSAVAAQPEGVYLLPDVVLNADGVTLDDMTADELASACRHPLRLVSSDAAGLLDGLKAAAGSL